MFGNELKTNAQLEYLLLRHFIRMVYPLGVNKRADSKKVDELTSDGVQMNVFMNELDVNCDLWLKKNSESVGPNFQRQVSRVLSALREYPVAYRKGFPIDKDDPRTMFGITHEFKTIKKETLHPIYNEEAEVHKMSGGKSWLLNDPDALKKCFAASILNMAGQLDLGFEDDNHQIIEFQDSENLILCGDDVVELSKYIDQYQLKIELNFQESLTTDFSNIEIIAKG